MRILPYTTVAEARAMELIELQQWWVEVSEAQSYLLGIANLPEDIRMCIAEFTSDAKRAVFDWRMRCKEHYKQIKTVTCSISNHLKTST